MSEFTADDANAASFAINNNPAAYRVISRIQCDIRDVQRNKRAIRHVEFDRCDVFSEQLPHETAVVVGGAGTPGAASVVVLTKLTRCLLTFDCDSWHADCKKERCILTSINAIFVGTLGMFTMMVCILLSASLSEEQCLLWVSAVMQSLLMQVRFSRSVVLRRACCLLLGVHLLFRCCYYCCCCCYCFLQICVTAPLIGLLFLLIKLFFSWIILRINATVRVRIRRQATRAVQVNCLDITVRLPSCF